MKEAIKHLRWQFGVWILALAASVAICVQPVAATESRSAQKVQGGQEDGFPPYGFPILVAGWDGTNVQNLLTDVTGKLLVTSTPSGTQTVQGTAADGAAASGNPVQTGGVDGSGNAQALLTDTSGRPQVVGAAADGAAAAGSPVQVGGVDGSGNAQAFLTDTSGRVIVNSNLADAGTVAGSGVNPIMMGGQDTGGLIRRLGTFVPSTDALGQSGQVALFSYSVPALLNASNVFERGRTAAAAANTTGTGLPAAGHMVFDTTNWQSARDAVAVGTGGIAGTGIQAMQLVGRAESGGTYSPVLTVNQDGNSGSRTLGVNAQGWNESNLDRWRNNTNVSLTTQTGATTTFTSADQTNFNGQHITVVLDMTVIGTGNVTLEIDGKDTISTKYYVILAGAAISSNSTNVYSVGPALPATANVSANAILPRTFRIKVTANNANATTYTVGYALNCN